MRMVNMDRLLCMMRLIGVTKEVAELLIAKDADVNAKNNYGKTPLDRAIQQKNRIYRPNP